jgi:dTDP-4-amino-4,6-dideoxygalactose transaminase
MIGVTRPDLPSIDDYIKYLEKIWSSRWLTNDGELVKLLEKKLEDYLETNNLISVTNGTFAIQLAIKALGLKGEVITTPFTFAATTNALMWEGLTPVFSDIDCETFNIDPQEVEKKITEKTSAILAVHVYGNPCYVEELQEIAYKHDLKLIYDAAHAFGVKYKNNSVLNYGDISTLSFHATKVFHTIEGGAIVVKDEDILEKLKLLRNHGIRSEDQVVLAGTNAKMNEFQAAMGLCNLETVDEKILSRKILYEYYKKQLIELPVKFQSVSASKFNYIYMPICFKDLETRDKVYLKLLEKGFKSRKYFYPLTANFDYFKIDNSVTIEKHCLANAIKISNRILCLPLYPDLEREVVCKIINIISEELGHNLEFQ